MNDEPQQAQSAAYLTGRAPSLPAQLAALLVRIYQLILSPMKQILFGSNCCCRFQPTCSCYARSALLQYGFWRGWWYAFRRILRCHPWHPGGYDPLPSLNKQKKVDNSAHPKSILDG
ncbi:MAG: membrane protein insertion efficiency factor YidD [Opitutae bacterium]|jgi:putative membrane protein insertion efficiency factor|nr:membrane protein insertion efficiency factor YidD [Opitutae bacterium]MDG1301488.1 membrane protein insertion efficiency factor YidD [Opitutae bacterium]